VASPEPVDRVTVTWADGSIIDEWLQVFFTPTPVTPAPPPLAFPNSLFWFGNLRGETGDGVAPNASTLRVNSIDLANLKRAVTSSAVPVDNRYDFNRDTRVNALDLGAIRKNVFHSLPLFTAPTPPGPPEPAAAAAPLAMSSRAPLAAPAPGAAPAPAPARPRPADLLSDSNSLLDG
jgi:hypothetical protein